MKIASFALTLGVALSLFTNAARATSTSLNVAQDVSIDAYAPYGNMGAAPAGQIGYDGTGVSRGLVRFNLAASPVPANAIINSASLSLDFINGSVTPGVSISVHMVTNSWAEGTFNNFPLNGVDGATWTIRSIPTPGVTNFWASAGGDFVASASATTNLAFNGTPQPVVYTFTGPGLATDVQSWLNNPNSNDGWLLQSSDEVTSSAFKTFLERENGSGWAVLTLDYTVVPEPASLGLILLGAGWLLALQQSRLAAGLARRRVLPRLSRAA